MNRGDIYFVSDVEPLHRGDLKCRPVVIVVPPEGELFDDTLFAVACTSQPPVDDRVVKVPLPWSTQSRARTGFRRETFAVPSWLLKLKVSQLDRQCGYVSSSELAAIVNAIPGLDEGGS